MPLDINPKGLVPAIEYEGKPLYESLVICEFLEDAYPDHKPQQLPSDPYDRAVVRLWVDYVKKSVIPAWFPLVQAQDKEKQEKSLKTFINALKTVSEKKKPGPYFLGNEWSLVDTIIAPWAVRDYIITEHRGYRRQDVSAAWEEWAKGLESRESVLKTASVCNP